LSARALRENPDDFSSVTAHEFFHLWNVKRIRPQALSLVDFTKENYTRALWFSEGVTSTVGEYALLQAGLMDEKGYLQRLSSEIAALESRPAHLTQSAEESSLDAWLEKYPSYRQSEHSVSYYNKGLLLGVMLDLAMRKASHDEASLRDLFLYLNQAYARKGKFFNESEGIRQAAESVSGGDFMAFFRKYVAGTEEIPYDDFLSWVGLQVVAGEKTIADADFRASRNFDAAPSVVSVAPGSAAEGSGLVVGDAILLVDGAAPVPSVEAKIRDHGPGDVLHLHVRTVDGTERDLSWKLGARKTAQYQIVNVESVTPEQMAHRKSWLAAAPVSPSAVPANSPQGTSN
jgi:predicted metalloprotease with PDZ domain